MTQRTTPTEFRANRYRLLDRVLETGESLEFEHRGQRLRVILDQGQKLSLLQPQPDYIRGEAGDIEHLDWSNEWRP